MSQERLPFHFIVNTAKAHLTKATISRKARMQKQELHFLRKFENLAGSALPSHPLYSERASESSVMEIETQLEDVRKRIKDLETCLQQEGSDIDSKNLDQSSVSGDGESLRDNDENYVFGVRAIPVTTRSDNVPVVGRPRQVRIQDSVDGSSDPTVGPAMKTLYKQFLGAGTDAKSVEEFRETLKALENLELDRKESQVEDYTKHKIESYQSKESKKTSTNSKSSKMEDLEMLKSFIASGWSLMSAENKKDGPTTSTSAHTREQCDKSPRKTSVHSYSHSRSGTEDEGPHIRNIREKLDGSRKESDIIYTKRQGETANSTRKVVEISELEKLRTDIANGTESWRKQHMQQIESLVAGALSDMRKELSQVRDEIHDVAKARGRSRMAIESMKKDNQHNLKEYSSRISNLSEDIQELKMIIPDREEIGKLLEMLDTDGIVTKTELQAFKGDQEAICGRILIEGEKDKAVIMDRVEHLSQLYLGGLEDVKTEVSNLKVSLDASSSARSEYLLAEMRRRSKKCSQFESLMKEKVEAASKLLEKYNMELDKAKEQWNLTLNLQDADERRAERFETSRLEQTALLNRIQSIEDRLLSVQSDPSIFANIEKHQEVIQSELQRLDEQMQEAVRRINDIHSGVDEEKLSGYRSELDTLGQKVRDATKSRTVILEKMTEMGKKMRKLEGAQVEFIRSIEEIRASTSDLEKSAATWLPKYESAADQLKDMDARLASAEDFIRECGNVQAENSKDGTEPATDSGCVELLHTRVETLEGRVEHVASATITNLRILDSKVEHYRVGVQSAIEGAAMAESKCGVLGAELVKVFRMLAARNGKLHEDIGTKRDTGSARDKVIGNCRYCKKPKDKTRDEFENDFPPYEDCYNDRHGQQAGPVSNGKGNESLSFIESYAESFYESGQNFKKNLTRSKPAADKLGKRKENKTGCKSCQRTNIRLEAGRIHVNVCHRVANAANRNRPDDLLVQPPKYA